jgi:hypothetical protein
MRSERCRRSGNSGPNRTRGMAGLAGAAFCRDAGSTPSRWFGASAKPRHYRSQPSRSTRRPVRVRTRAVVPVGQQLPSRGASEAPRPLFRTGRFGGIGANSILNIPDIKAEAQNQRRGCARAAPRTRLPKIRRLRRMATDHMCTRTAAGGFLQAAENLERDVASTIPNPCSVLAARNESGSLGFVSSTERSPS